MTTIKCQAKHDKNGGCSTCGGYGSVIVKSFCGKCKKPYWGRPGNYTMYEGKRWRSFDGLAIRSSMEHGVVCAECYEENPSE